MPTTSKSPARGESHTTSRPGVTHCCAPLIVCRICPLVPQPEMHDAGLMGHVAPVLLTVTFPVEADSDMPLPAVSVLTSGYVDDVDVDCVLSWYSPPLSQRPRPPRPPEATAVSSCDALSDRARIIGPFCCVRSSVDANENWSHCRGVL